MESIDRKRELLAKNGQPSPLRFPVLEHGAESLVQGYLMRRNILTYQAPRKNEGYDLICIHPDPRRTVKPIRVQVKSRYQTDCDGAIIVPLKSRKAYDFVIAVFLNVGCFYNKQLEKCEPEFFTLPARWIDRNRNRNSSWGRVPVKKRGREVERFKNDKGFEQIAKLLGIAPLTRPSKLRKAKARGQRPTTND